MLRTAHTTVNLTLKKSLYAIELQHKKQQCNQTLSYLHYLHCIFAREWTQVVGRVGRRWPNVRVGQLVPIIREDCPGGVQRN